MDKCIRKAYAKINLGLDVVRRLENGYHEVRMIMQTVGIYDVLTLENGVAPVGAVFEGIAFKANVFASPDAHAVRTAVVFFSFRVESIAAVDVGAFFTDDGDVFGIQRPDQTVAPTAGGDSTASCGGSVADGFDGHRLQGILQIRQIILRIPAALQDCAGFQIQFHIGADTQATCEVNTAGDHNSAAAGKEAIVNGILDGFGL